MCPRKSKPHSAKYLSLVVIKIKYRQKSVANFVRFGEICSDGCWRCTRTYHIRTSPTYVQRDILSLRFYAKHSKMKMFKIRPRRVSGKRRSAVFWRVVVNIFIFRNSWNIHTLDFGTFMQGAHHQIPPFFFSGFGMKRVERGRTNRQTIIYRRVVPLPLLWEMWNYIYAHLEEENKDIRNKSEIVARRFIDLLSLRCKWSWVRYFVPLR